MIRMLLPQRMSAFGHERAIVASTGFADARSPNLLSLLVYRRNPLVSAGQDKVELRTAVILDHQRVRHNWNWAKPGPGLVYPAY